MGCGYGCLLTQLEEDNVDFGLVPMVGGPVCLFSFLRMYVRLYSM